MGMLVACSQVGRMRRMMKKQMLYMQHWTRGWMKDVKKEGYLKKDHLFYLSFKGEAKLLEAYGV